MSLAPMRYHETCRNMPDISSSFKASPPIALPGRCRGATMRVPKKRGPWSCKTSRGTPGLIRCIQVSCFLLWRPLCSPGRRVVKNENQKRRHVKLRHIFSSYHSPLCTPKVLDLSLRLMIGHVHLALLFYPFMKFMCYSPQCISGWEKIMVNPCLDSWTCYMSHAWQAASFTPSIAIHP